MNASTTKKNSEGYAMKNPNPKQHYRLSLEKAKQDYRDGILTATGLVYYAIGIYRAPGQKLRVSDVEEFCDRLNINRATFYRAISKLKSRDRIDWEAIGGVDVWIVTSKVTQLHTVQEVSQNCEIKSQNCETELQDSEIKSQDGESLLPNGEIELPDGDNEALELLFCKDSSDSSDNLSNRSSNSFQILIKTLSENERMKFLEFCQSQQKPQDWIEEHHVTLWQQFQTESCVEQQKSGLVKSSAPFSPKYDQFIRPPKPRPKFMYPEGDWLNSDGCINEAFIRHRATLWQKSHKFADMTIEDVMGLVCNHYMKANNHPNLQNDWTAYCRIAARHVEAIAHRVEAGISIKPAEQQEIVEKLPAAMAVKDAIADSAYSSPVPTQLPSSVVPVAALPPETPQESTAPKGAINPDAYKPLKSLAKDERIAQEIEQLDEQQCLQNRLELSRMIRNSLVGSGKAIAKRNNSNPTGDRIHHPTIDPEQADRELEERKQQVLAEYRKTISAPTEEDRILERLRDPETRDSAIAFANARGYDVSLEDDGTPTLEKLEF